jgi:hypothetical protein
MDRRSIKFFDLPEKEDAKEELQNDYKQKIERELAFKSPLPDNPENVPGFKLVRTIFGTKKVCLCVLYGTFDSVGRV